MFKFLLHHISNDLYLLPVIVGTTVIKESDFKSSVFFMGFQAFHMYTAALMVIRLAV